MFFYLSTTWLFNKLASDAVFSTFNHDCNYKHGRSHVKQQFWAFIQQTEAGLLNKSSSLATALGVTATTNVLDLISVNFVVLLKSDLDVQQTHLSDLSGTTKCDQIYTNDIYEFGYNWSCS